MRPRTVTLPILLAAWLPAAALAHSTHPEISASRAFDPASATPGQTVTVTITVEVGNLGADPVRGFWISDPVPAGLAPTTGTVTLNSGGLTVAREAAQAGAVVPGCTLERWVLETPPAWAEGNPVAAASTLVVTYRVTVPGDASPGEIEFPGFSWVGMVAAQGDAGDHFGFEDAAARLAVEEISDDLDGDGMPNDWETAHGLDPDDPADADADPDADGLTNLEEYRNDTDPNAADSDGDGMPDGWEVANGLDPGSDDAAADADGDGFANLEEHQEGSDPQDPESTPEGEPNQPPVATCAAEPASGEAPLEVTFTGTGTDPDPDGSVVGYDWSFGDGEAGSGQGPTHTYDRPGTYVAELTVTDDRGGTGRDTVSILVFEPSGEDPDTTIVGGCGCGARGAGGLAAWWILLSWLAATAVRRPGCRRGPVRSSRRRSDP
jgi:uncharacterized repeat protein (TIGR01451 family)